MYCYCAKVKQFSNKAKTLCQHLLLLWGEIGVRNSLCPTLGR